MNNIEYKWVGEHHAAVIVNGNVEAYINRLKQTGEWELHFPQEVSLKSFKENSLLGMQGFIDGYFGE